MKSATFASGAFRSKERQRTWSEPSHKGKSKGIYFDVHAIVLLPVCMLFTFAGKDSKGKGKGKGKRENWDGYNQYSGERPIKRQR